MSETSPMTTCPACGVKDDRLLSPAFSPEIQMQHLEVALHRFQEEPSFDNAELFVLNVRFGWALMPMQPTTRDAQAARMAVFLDLVKRGLAILEELQPVTAEQERLKSNYLRIGGKRREWAELLSSTGDAEQVERATMEYVQQALDQADAENC